MEDSPGVEAPARPPRLLEQGHSSVETTMIYTHVMNKGGRGVNSPLDAGRLP